MPRNGSAPTIKYSTSFEFKHSINSRKSLLKGIGVGSLSQFEEYASPLLRAHLTAGNGVGGVGFLEAVEDANYFLHNLILLRLFDCTSQAQFLRAKERGWIGWGDVTCPRSGVGGDSRRSFE